MVNNIINMAMLGCLFGASLCFLNVILLPCFIPSCTIFVDNSMVSSQILMKRARVSFSMHDCQDSASPKNYSAISCP